MSNLLIDKNLKKKISWYIRAHGHSSIGGLNLIMAYFQINKDMEAIHNIEDCIKNFEHFSFTNNLKFQHDRLIRSIVHLQNYIKSLKIQDDKKSEMLVVLEGVWKSVNIIDSIIKKPDYEEYFYITKILGSTMTALLERYPNILFGDYIGVNGKDVGNIVEIHINTSGEEKKILGCGYELQLLLFNIIANAIDSILEMEKKGNIWLNFLFQEDISIEMIDDGQLITQENLIKIRNRDLFSTKGTSHGMGMKIIYDILDKYEGKLEISNHPNTKIKIKLPLG